jgi:hypothetical protein
MIVAKDLRRDELEAEVRKLVMDRVKENWQFRSREDGAQQANATGAAAPLCRVDTTPHLAWKLLSAVH